MKIFLVAVLVFVALFGIYNITLNNWDNPNPGRVSETVNSVFTKPTLPPAPNSKTLTNGVHVFQTYNNCGPASLSMALSYFGTNVSQEDLGKALRPYQIPGGDNDDKSVTLQELAKKAEEYGFVTYHRPNGNKDLIKYFIAQDIPVIARTWTKDGEDIGHFRVVKGYDEVRKVIIQDDSLQGKNLEYSYDSFNGLWKAFGYEYLVLIPQEKIDIARLILGENFDKEIAWKNMLESTEKVIAQNPSDVYANFNKLVALSNLGNYEESVKVYESIEGKLPPRMLWYQIEPIVAYQKVKNYNKVFEITDSLIKSGNRGFSEIYQIRGEIYLAQENNDLANIEFNKVAFYNKYFYKYWE